jgi:hypothetical protein
MRVGKSEAVAQQFMIAAGATAAMYLLAEASAEPLRIWFTVGYVIGRGVTAFALAMWLLVAGIEIILEYFEKGGGR